jgi:hypothetical protein
MVGSANTIKRGGVPDKSQVDKIRKLTARAAPFGNARSRRSKGKFIKINSL